MPNLLSHWWTRISEELRNVGEHSRRRRFCQPALSRFCSVEAIEERVLLSASGVLPSGAAIRVGTNFSGSFAAENYFHIENTAASPGNEGVAVTSTTYFTASDGVNGKELWRINNLTGGEPVMVEDSIPGGGIDNLPSGSFPHELTNANGTLYFTATDSSYVMRLWRINNSTGIAEIVTATLPDTNLSSVQQLTSVGDTLYFTGDGQLWRVKPGQNAERMGAGVVDTSYLTPIVTNLFSPSFLTNLNGTLYFRADQYIDGTFSQLAARRLWRTTSTGGVELVSAAYRSDVNSPAYEPILGSLTALIVANDALYFDSDGPNGQRLWRVSNSETASILANSRPAGGGLTNVNGTLYFISYDSTNGSELWKINNDSAGTALLVEDAIPGGGIGPGSSNSYARYLTNVNGTLFFAGANGPDGLELWKVNSAGSAVMVEDAIPGRGINNLVGQSSVPEGLTNVNGTLFFTANDSVNGKELWRVSSADGSIAEMVEDSLSGGGINPGSEGASVRNLTNVNGTLYFSAYEPTNGGELWRAKPLGQAELVEDSVPGSGITAGASGSYPRYMMNVNGTLFFTAFSDASGFQPWKVTSDTNAAPKGTTATVTTLEDTPYSFNAESFGFSDPVNNPQNGLQAVKLTTLPANGSLRLNGVPITTEGLFVSAANINAGKLKFRPPLNANGVSYTSFTFQVQDDGGTSNGGVDLDPTPRTLTIDVTPVNDAPVPQQDPELDPITITVRMGFPLSYHFASNTFLDPEGDNFTLSASDPNGNGLPFAPYILSFQPGPGSGEGILIGTPSQSNLLLHNPYPPNLKQYIQIAATDSSGQIGFTTVELNFEASPERSAPAIVYVDPTFHLTAPDDPDGDDPATELGYDAFDDIQSAIEAVTDGGTVVIHGGEYSSSQTIDTSFGRFKPLTISLGAGASGEGVAKVVLHAGLNLHPGITLRMDLVGSGSVPGVDYDQLVVDQRIDLGPANLELGGSLTPRPGSTYELVQANSFFGQFNSLNTDNTISFNNRTLKVNYLTTGQPDVVSLSYVVQRGLWTGAGDGTSWNDALNWDGDFLPTPDDDVVIANSTTHVVIAGNDVSVRSLTAGGSLEIADGVTFSSTGIVSVNAGITLYGTIKDTTIQMQAGQDRNILNVEGSYAVLDGVTVGESVNIMVGPRATLALQNGMILNGSLHLASPLEAGGVTMRIDNDTRISGRGTLVIGDTDDQLPSSTVEIQPFVTLTLGHELTTIGHNGFFTGSSLVNQGSVNVPNGGYYFFSLSTESFVNNGTMDAASDATLRINVGDWHNSDDELGHTAWIRNEGILFLEGNWRNNDGAGRSGKITNSGIMRMRGVLQNSGQQFVLDSGINFLEGTIQGGVIRGVTGSAGTVLEVIGQNAVLASVEVANNLGVVVRSGATLAIANDLTLNGSLTLASTQANGGSTVRIANTSTVSGTGNFVIGSASLPAIESIVTIDPLATLTLGSGITTTSYSGRVRGNALVNQGRLLSADGSHLGGIKYLTTIETANFVNNGTIDIKPNSSMRVFSTTWVNSDDGAGHVAVINLDRGGLQTRGIWSNSDGVGRFGAITGSGGPLFLDGVLLNAGQQFDVSRFSQVFLVGTIRGGSIRQGTQGDVQAYGTAATLDGVTIESGVDFHAELNGSALTLFNGLQLNGTLTIGPEQQGSSLRIGNTMTISGADSLMVQNTFNNTPATVNISPGELLTLGGDLSTTLGRGARFVGGALINNGRIETRNSAQTVTATISTVTFVNNGTTNVNASTSLRLASPVSTNNGTIQNSGTVDVVGQLTNNATSNVQQSSTGVFNFYADLSSPVTDRTRFSLAGAVNFLPGTAPVQQFEAMSQDLGATYAGFASGFTVNAVSLKAGSLVKLVDSFRNSGAATEAIYVASLDIQANASIDLNGLHIYTYSLTNSGSVIDSSPGKTGKITLIRPASRVEPLPPTASSLTIPIRMSVTSAGPLAPRVTEFDLYVAQDSGAWIKYPAIPADRDSATTVFNFNATSNHTYSYYCIARYNNGNQEIKSSIQEAIIRVNDLDKPNTQILNYFPQYYGSYDPLDLTKYFVNSRGGDVGGSRIVQVDYYVAIDSGDYFLFASDTASRVVAEHYLATGHGVHFPFIPDGNPHEYRFYSRAIDSSGNMEDAPLVPDVILPAESRYSVVAAPPLSPSWIDVQGGAAQRSYITKVAMNFLNATDLSAFINADRSPTSRIIVRKYAINARQSDLVDPSKGIAVANLKVTETTVPGGYGRQLLFDFSQSGTAAATTAADGVYRIFIDVDGSGHLSASDSGDRQFGFHRLLGDANGDGVVNSGNTVGTDSWYIDQLMRTTSGNLGLLLDGDLDGNGIVNAADKARTTTSYGAYENRKIRIDLFVYVND